MCFWQFFHAFQSHVMFPIFPGCVWWFCDVSSSCSIPFKLRWRPGANHTQPANWCPGHPSSDFVPCLAWQTALGKGCKGCLVNFFSLRSRRHSEDAQNQQTYKRCRRNMLDQGHDMAWRTETERELCGIDCNILKTWQNSAMQAASTPICLGVYQTLSRGFVNLLLLGSSQSCKKSQEFERQLQPVVDATALDGSFIEKEGGRFIFRMLFYSETGSKIAPKHGATVGTVGTSEASGWKRSTETACHCSTWKVYERWKYRYIMVYHVIICYHGISESSTDMTKSGSHLAVEFPKSIGERRFSLL